MSEAEERTDTLDEPTVCGHGLDAEKCRHCRGPVGSEELELAEWKEGRKP